MGFICNMCEQYIPNAVAHNCPLDPDEEDKMSDLSDEELIARAAQNTVPPLKEGAEAHEELVYVPADGTPSLGAQAQITFWDEYSSPLGGTGLISLDPSQVQPDYKAGDRFKLHDKQYLIDGRRLRVEVFVTEG